MRRTRGLSTRLVVAIGLLAALHLTVFVVLLTTLHDLGGADRHARTAARVAMASNDSRIALARGDAGEGERALAEALPLLSEAAGSEVTGHVGDHEPLMAIEDAIHRAPYDEIVISTLPHRLSRWLHLDLVSKARGTGLPVMHVEASERASEPAATA